MDGPLQITLAPRRARPDVLFSSEPYGDEIARRFGARAVDVDPVGSSCRSRRSMIRAEPSRCIPGSAVRRRWRRRPEGRSAVTCWAEASAAGRA